MTTHTSTPWYTVGDNRDRIYANGQFLVAKTAGDTDQEAEANSEFIIRAVNNYDELVALLAGALSQIQYMRVDLKGLDGLPSVEHESCQALERQIHDAVKKALGK